MKIVRLPLFAALGAMASAAGGARAQAGRQPIDWSTVSLDSIGGGPMPTAGYRGRVVLLVNTASRCGFTNQYEGLESLYSKYGPKGLVVLGFPSNDFGNQEPGNSKQIADLCFNTYGVKFPMFAKTTVVGQNANPLYAALAKSSGTAPKWNFHKYLIDRSGNVVGNYSSRITPDDKRLAADIEKVLSQR